MGGIASVKLVGRVVASTLLRQCMRRADGRASVHGDAEGVARFTGGRSVRTGPGIRDPGTKRTRNGAEPSGTPRWDAAPKPDPKPDTVPRIRIRCHVTPPPLRRFWSTRTAPGGVARLARFIGRRQCAGIGRRGGVTWHRTAAVGGAHARTGEAAGCPGPAAQYLITSSVVSASLMSTGFGGSCQLPQVPSSNSTSTR